MHICLTDQLSVLTSNPSLTQRTTVCANVRWVSWPVCAPALIVLASVLVAANIAEAQINVTPQQLKLAVGNEAARLVTTLRTKRGLVDVTRKAMLTSADPKIARVVKGRVQPVRAGSTKITVAHGNHRQTVEVQVAPKSKQKPSFRYGPLVAFTKHKCNSGGCHGAPSGKGGFRLSLFAYDPELDAETTRREFSYRRANRFEPSASLLLLKPLMKVPHGGGQQIRKSDPGYRLLLNWIAAGCPLDDAKSPRCEKIEVFPKQRILRLPDPQQQLLVRGHFSDGSVRDITDLVVYSSSHDAIASVDDTGLVSGAVRGEVAIMVRYLEQTTTSRIMVLNDNPKYVWRPVKPFNYIDRHVLDRLRLLQITPSQLANDQQFVRRVYLDAIGLLPSKAEVQRFLADKRSNKRALLIDELLRRPEFSRYWATKWGDLLRLTSGKVTTTGAHKLHRWLVNHWQSNTPYDQFVTQLITASGSTYENPAANFYRTAGSTDDCTETVAQVFLGARMQCAKCHNHPYERWTQDNYYGIGAFFVRIQRTKLPSKALLIWEDRKGEVTQPRTKKQMKPWAPGVGELEIGNDSDRRQELARWLTSPKNPYLARVEVNRIWAAIMGRGIVDPPDDFRDSNPPANPQLLDALAEDFRKHKFDRQHIIRVILNSRTYQLDSRSNKDNQDDSRFASHALARRMSAEQLFDAFGHLTGAPKKFKGLPADTKATQLPGTVSDPLLEIFGKPRRNSVCECERSDRSDLRQSMELINGKYITNQIRHPNGRLKRMIKAKRTDPEMVTEFYYAGYARQPSKREMKIILDYIKRNKNREQAFEDLVWSIVNSKEFTFQH